MKSRGSGRERRNRMSFMQRRNLKGWLFVSPFVFGFLIYYLFVFIQSFVNSFYDLRMTADGLQYRFIGWDNYYYALRVNPDFVKTLAESIGGMLLDMAAVLVFSLFIATLLNQRLAGRGIFRMIFFIPVILATGIVEKSEMNNVLMQSMSTTEIMGMNQAADALSAAGMDLGNYLQRLDISPAVVDTIVDLASRIYDIVKKSGVQILVFLGGLQAISPAIYEAADIEGVTAWEAFWKITVPIISPMIFVNAVYTVIDSFIRPSNQVIILIDNVSYGETANYGGATAMSWLYTVVILVFLAVLTAVFARTVFYQTRD